MLWREVSEREIANGLNKKGVFIERGFEFLNTRNIDELSTKYVCRDCVEQWKFEDKKNDNNNQTWR